MEKNINVILSPMSHHSARAKMPRSSRFRARGGQGRARGTPKAAHPSSCCLPGPAPMPSPSLQLGTPVAPGTSVAQGQLSWPWKASEEFAFIFAFPNCACGFPGAAPGFGFHGRFCVDPENRGRHKGATMDLPLTRIKGGRRGGTGRGHHGRGHRSLAPPPQRCQHRGGCGDPPQAGEEAGRRRILVGRWWFWHCQSSSGDTTPVGLLRGARTRPSCPPPFSFPVIFRRLFIHLGWVSFLLPYSI